MQCRWTPLDGGFKCEACGAWRPKMVRRVCRPGAPGRTKSDPPRGVAPSKKKVKATRHSIFKLAWRYIVAQVRERLVAKTGRCRSA